MISNIVDMDGSFRNFMSKTISWSFSSEKFVDIIDEDGGWINIKSQQSSVEEKDSFDERHCFILIN